MRCRIVIVGSGFGGIAAAQGLAKVDADVVLIDRTNHHLFQPLLYQVAGAALSPAEIASANRALLRPGDNLRILMADVVGIDTDLRQVILAEGPPESFDYLVLATGAAYSFFGHDAWADHAFVLKTLEDALAIRRAVLGAFERAERSLDEIERTRLLTFAIVGGGPTGVEMAGTIAELARSTVARDFTRIDPRTVRVVLCEADRRLLTAFDEDQSAYAATALRSLGVELRFGRSVSAIDVNGLTIGDERIEAGVVVWAAGTKARPAAEWLDVEASGNGAVKVGADCSVAGHPGIFAIGDVSSFATPNGNLPGLASVAKQQGRFVAKLIASHVANKPLPATFRYRDYGTMAIIGRSRAVASICGLKMHGFTAWLAWSLVHLVLLMNFRNRVAVYLNWSWSWFTYGRSARLITSLETVHDTIPVVKRSHE